MYSLAACNQAGERRLQAMLDEFALGDIDALSDFIIDTSRKATQDAIAAVPQGTFTNSMQVDGYHAPVLMQVRLDISQNEVIADFSGTSAMSKFGVNCPEVYTRAYACYGLKCAIAPQVPNNSGSLEPFRITAPEGCILAARRPAPVSVRHVMGHLVPDVVLGALHMAMPGTVPAEGASALWNIQISARPSDPQSDLPSAEVLMFNSGGTGARPGLDGLSATAFPSGVSTMSVEATEHVGPITVWRKDLRDGSGGAGQQRGGLGQVIEIEPRAGYDIYFNAMFDRVHNPARGRDGGGAGAAGRVELSDGTPLKPKGRQLIKEGQRLRLCLPGGGGYGPPKSRSGQDIANDLAAGYITPEQAQATYGRGKDSK
jgi:N-methylhydantoinase B